MDGTTSNSKEVGTILPQNIKIESGLGESPSASLEDETRVTLCNVNTETTAFGFQRNAESEFQIGSNNGKEVEVISPEVVKSEPVLGEPLGGSQMDETDVISCGANCEMTMFNFKENSVAKSAYDMNNSEKVAAVLPEKEIALQELESNTNNREEVETVLPEVVKIEPAPKELLCESQTSELSSCDVNREITVLGVGTPEPQSSTNYSKKVSTVLPENENTLLELELNTNNGAEVETNSPEVIKIELAPKKPSSGSLIGETEVTSCSVNREIAVFGIEENPVTESQSNTNNSKEVGTVPPEKENTLLELELNTNNRAEVETISPEVIKIELAPKKPLKGSLIGETEVTSCSVNREIAVVGIEENPVTESRSNTNNSKEVGTVLPEKENAMPELRLNTNNRGEVETVLPEIVKIESEPEEPLSGSRAGETEVTSCSVNREIAVFGVEKNAVTESRTNTNNSEKVGTVLPEKGNTVPELGSSTNNRATVFPELVKIEPSSGSRTGETEVTLCSVNQEMAVFSVGENAMLESGSNRSKEVGTVLLQIAKSKAVIGEPSNGSLRNVAGTTSCSKNGEIAEFEETNLMTFLDVKIKTEEEEKSGETQESLQYSSGGAVCEMQEALRDLWSIKEENDSDDNQVHFDDVAFSVPSNDDQIISETDETFRCGSETQSRIHYDSNRIKLRYVWVKLEDLFPRHVRDLGLAHSNMGLCSCIYCRREYRYSNESKLISKDSQNEGQPVHSQNFCNKSGKGQKYKGGFDAETRDKVQKNRIIFQCDKCYKKFKNRIGLNTHLLVHGNSYKCKYCPQQFAMMSPYYAHLELHVKKRFKCEQCSANFWHRSTFEEHLRVHSREKPFQCEVCFTKFARKNTLKTHMRTHMDNRLYKCAQCPADFKYKSNLTVHVRLHSGEKPFKCNYCPAVFLTSTNLKGHLRQHSGEQPYKCKHCNARFKRSSALKDHLTVHSDEKPFQCKLCPERFKRRTGVKVHAIKCHKGATKFECKLCPERFVDSRTLNIHQLRHSSEDRYGCAYCSAKFVMRPHLTRHLKRCH